MPTIQCVDCGKTFEAEAGKRCSQCTGEVARSLLDALQPNLEDEPKTDAPLNDEIVKSVQRLAIDESHAVGGLGEVFRAQDLELSREVALKVIQPRHQRSDDLRRRFLVEGEVTANLDHPGVVPVYGRGSLSDGRPFYAMRFVEGETLKDAIEALHEQDAPAADLRRLLRHFVDVCNIIEYAHSRHILHRDIKPANIMIGEFGQTLVVDWGLAQKEKVDAEPDSHSSAIETSNWNPMMSGIGTDGGSPAYMSPEQLQAGEESTRTTDVFQLGATLYHILCGRAPYQGLSSEELPQRIADAGFARPRSVRPSIPKSLEAICNKAMSHSSRDRYQSARDLGLDVERFTSDQPVAAWREPLVTRVRRFVLKHPVEMTVAISMLGIASLMLIVFVLAEKNSSLSTANALIDRSNATLDEKNKALARSKDALEEANGSLDEVNQELVSTNEVLERLVVTAGNSNGRDVPSRLAMPAFVEALSMADEDSDSEDLQRLRIGLTLEYSPRIQYVWEGGRDLQHAAFSPSGDLIVAAAGGGQAQVWETTTGRAITPVLEHDAGLLHACFSQDERRLFAASIDGTVTAWDLESGQIEFEISVGEPVRVVVISPDGRELITGSGSHISPYGGAVRFWNAQNGTEIGEPLPIQGEVNQIVFSPSQTKLLVTAFVDESLAALGASSARVWDWPGKTPLSPVVTTKFGHLEAAFANQEQQIIVCSGRNSPTDGEPGAETAEAIIVDMDNGQVERFALDHNQWITTLIADDAHDRFLTAGYDGDIKSWHYGTCSPAETWSATALIVNEIAMSPDGSMLAAAMNNGDVELWDRTRDSSFQDVLPHAAFVKQVSFSPDGTQLLTTSSDRLIRLWSLVPRRPVPSFVHDAPAAYVEFLPDGQLLAMTGFQSAFIGTNPFGDSAWLDGIEPNRAFVYDLRTSRALGSSGNPRGPTIGDFCRRTLQVAIVPEPRSSTTEVQIWDVFGKGPPIICDPEGPPIDAAFSPDGKRLVIAYHDQEHGDAICFWNLETQQRGSLRMSFSERWPTTLSNVSFSPDGTRIMLNAQSDVDGRKTYGVTLVDPDAMTQIDRGQGLENRVFSRFSPDGKRAILGSRAFGGGRSHVFDTENTNVFPGSMLHGTQLSFVGILSDGSTAVSASIDGEVRFWDPDEAQPDIASESETQQATLVSKTVYHEGAVHHVTESPDGRLIATASSDRTCRIWDRQTGQPVGPPLRHPDIVWHCAFDSSGQRLATACDDGTVRIWDLARDPRDFETIKVEAELNSARRYERSTGLSRLVHQDMRHVAEDWQELANPSTGKTEPDR